MGGGSSVIRRKRTGERNDLPRSKGAVVVFAAPSFRGEGSEVGEPASPGRPELCGPSLGMVFSKEDHDAKNEAFGVAVSWVRPHIGYLAVQGATDQEVWRLCEGDRIHSAFPIE